MHIHKNIHKGGFPPVLGAISYYARYLATRKIVLELLRIESHHHDNGNPFNRTSMGIDLFNRIPVIRGFRGACYVFFTSKIHAIKKMKRTRFSDTRKVRS
jgi:hypothetical protein